MPVRELGVAWRRRFLARSLCAVFLIVWKCPLQKVPFWGRHGLNQFVVLYLNPDLLGGKIAILEGTRCCGRTSKASMLPLRWRRELILRSSMSEYGFYVLCAYRTARWGSVLPHTVPICIFREHTCEDTHNIHTCTNKHIHTCTYIHTYVSAVMHACAHT